MSKSNIQHLRNIISEYELENTEEAMEFIEAVENDLIENNDRITKLQNEYDELENSIEEESVSFDNEDFVGLDTIQWSLQKGNLAIQQKMERFIEQLQKSNAVVPA